MPKLTQQGPDDTRNLGGIARVVVKIGSGVIAGQGQLRPEVIASLARDVGSMIERQLEVVMVVSGAVAAGYRALGLSEPPMAVVERQSAAAVGQYRLMTRLSEAFAEHRIPVAQLLMMEEDIDNRRRFLSARHTLQLLIERGVLPVINENDPLADDQIGIGDNDHLAALVTNLVTADLLVILSSVHGIHLDGASGPILRQVDIGSSVDHHITPDTSECGVGGMAAKVAAAHLASRWGVPTIIANGTTPGLLPRILQGEPIGTLFQPGKRQLKSRKRWIAIRARSRGTVQVDAGARDAILHRGASLLPSGVIDVQGRFSMGARVDIADPGGTVFAVGLVSYSSEEIRRMRGKKRADFQRVLGYKYVDEIIGRDDLVRLEE